VISHTAIQEFKVGSGERGRSMFESCLRNYPARLDVWSQYLDQVSQVARLEFAPSRVDGDLLQPFAILHPLP